MKILIAVPCMDQVAVGFAQSLATLNKVGECKLFFLSGSLIYESRNKIAKEAIRLGVDYVLWLDSDIVFGPDTLEKLLSDEKDIVSGLYFRRVMPYTPVLFKKLSTEDEKPSWEGYDDYPPGIFEVEGIGFGCVLVKAQVLWDMAAKYKDWFSPMFGFGEDLSFCLRARDLGYKVYCDSGVKCGHVGTVTVTDDFYRAIRRRNEET